MPNFNDMNETDVREIIVRPFLESLGYKHGTSNNIKTEQTFRYGKTFLGRKNPAKDPAISGRADYILDVVGVGRWVVEVKAPSEDITRDVVEQAHTYAAHPEVAALFFLVTNGRTFQLYRTSSLSTPLMAWEWEDIEEVQMSVGNLVGPEAIRRKMKLLEADKGNPLAPNISSNVKIIGGYIRYEDHSSNHGIIDAGIINGLELPVTSGEVGRLEDGQIFAVVKTAKSSPLMGIISALNDREEEYKFCTSAKYISTDPESPTIFQSLYQNEVPIGTMLSIPGLGQMASPFGFRILATTDAVGFVENDIFKGTMQLRYEFFFDKMPFTIRMAIEQRLGRLPSSLHAEGGGKFEVQLLNT